MTHVYLVRHAQASFGAADYDQLSALGQRQAVLLGQWWRQTGRRIDSIAMGTLQRHRQTAEACLTALGADNCDNLVDAGFNEYDHEAILRWPKLARDLTVAGMLLLVLLGFGTRAPFIYFQF